ncbi:hypothetical protein GGR53DRAFT_468510 [Hypoxylon sp. FL1150]|nr:hypothetical protein GGR53DRAFT_468510 [Hypoxylon sp. FL1150]
MGEVNEYGSFREGDIVGHMDATVKSVVHFANNVQDSLDGIRDNTRSLYWWTSVLVGICIGLFVLAQLVRLRHELQTITQYQELFMRMWDDDRRRQEERYEEEKRERQIEERNRRARAAARQYRGGKGGFSGRDEGASSSGVNHSPKTPTRGRGIFGNNVSGATRVDIQEENTPGLSRDDPVDLTTLSPELAAFEDASVGTYDKLDMSSFGNSKVDTVPRVLSKQESSYGNPFGNTLGTTHLKSPPRLTSNSGNEMFPGLGLKAAPTRLPYGSSAFSSSVNNLPNPFGGAIENYGGTFPSSSHFGYSG